MHAFFVISFGILGILIGSFLNVVILRMGTGRGIGGRSACFSCNKTLKWYELFPVFSFLFQHGKCNHCGSKISWQYPLVELATGLLFASIAYQFWGSFLFIPWLLIVALGIVIAVYDFRHKMIPLYPLIGMVILGVFLKASVVGFVLVPLLFLILWIISKGKWIGFGDVEIMAGLGFLLGVIGGFSAVLLGFWIAAAGLIFWMMIQRKSYASMRHVQIPMGPFLLLGMYLVGVWGIDVVKWLVAMV